MILASTIWVFFYRFNDSAGGITAGTKRDSIKEIMKTDLLPRMETKTTQRWQQNLICISRITTMNLTQDNKTNL